MKFIGIGLALAFGAVQATAQKISPFSAAFFPQESQLELSTGLAHSLSSYTAHSVLSEHQGDTVALIASPGLRWGVSPNWALEVIQPIAHRLEVDAFNPNVGPEGLRAPTVTMAHLLEPSALFRVKLAGMLQVNPWSNTGLNQWGGSVTGILTPSDKDAVTLGLAGGVNPSNQQRTTSLSATWAHSWGPWLTQGAISTTRFGAFSNNVGHSDTSEVLSTSLELSREMDPDVWAGLAWSVARNANHFNVLPTAQLPMAIVMDNRTLLRTISLTIRVLR